VRPDEVRARASPPRRVRRVKGPLSSSPSLALSASSTPQPLMFYNTEVLTSRKGGFAVFWLAATVGAKGTTAVRKLTKKELLTCNIVKAWCAPSTLVVRSVPMRRDIWRSGVLLTPRLASLAARPDSEKVIQPDEPLALRLSANLLFGISRVFSHKVRRRTQPDMVLAFGLRAWRREPDLPDRGSCCSQYALYAGDVQHVQQALRKVINDAALTMRVASLVDRTRRAAR